MARRDSTTRADDPGTAKPAVNPAQQLEEADRRIASLECSLRVYRDHPAAAARVAQQLDQAYGTLAELERNMRGMR